MVSFDQARKNAIPIPPAGSVVNNRGIKNLELLSNTAAALVCTSIVLKSRHIGLKAPHNRIEIIEACDSSV